MFVYVSAKAMNKLTTDTYEYHVGQKEFVLKTLEFKDAPVIK